MQLENPLVSSNTGYGGNKLKTIIKKRSRVQK